MEATGTDTRKNEMKYEKSELELMTTYQLREICRREKYCINFTFILYRFVGRTKLGTSFQREKPERMEEIEWQSRV